MPIETLASSSNIDNDDGDSDIFTEGTI
jgi:hypothetical protein